MSKTIIIEDWAGNKVVLSPSDFVEKYGPSDDSHNQQYDFLLKLTTTLIENGSLKEKDLYDVGYGLFPDLCCAGLEIEEC